MRCLYRANRAYLHVRRVWDFSEFSEDSGIPTRHHSHPADKHLPRRCIVGICRDSQIVTDFYYPFIQVIIVQPIIVWIGKLYGERTRCALLGDTKRMQMRISPSHRILDGNMQIEERAFRWNQNTPPYFRRALIQRYFELQYSWADVSFSLCFPVLFVTVFHVRVFFYDPSFVILFLRFFVPVRIEQSLPECQLLLATSHA